MKKILIFSLFLTSCNYFGKVKTEEGIVLGKSYTPSQSSTGVGVSSSGNLVTTTSSTSEEYCVIFRCFEHNKTFVIKRKELYTRLFEKDTVIITYNGVYSKHDSSFVDFNFIDAVKK